MKNKKAKFYFILFFCLSSIQFFSPAISLTSLTYYVYYAIFIITFLLVIVNYKKSYYTSFSLPILLMLVAEIVSAFNAAYSWNQNLVDSLKAILPYMAYLLFFLLIIWKFGNRDIERLIVILGMAYIIVYLISFLIYPTILFGKIDEFGDTRGFQRIRTDGIGFLFLFAFFSLSQYIIKRRFLWLAIYSLCIVCIIMSLTRTYIIFSFLFSAIFILQKSSILTKIVVVVIATFGFYIVTQMNFYKLLIAQTDTQISDIKNDIRVQSADYYLNDFPPNLYSKFLGNGQPYKNTGYAKFVNYLELDLGLYTADIGYIGLYVKFGILAIIAYLILIYRILKISVTAENLYCKYFLVFIFTISFIIDAPFNTSFIPAIILAIYALSTQSENNNETLQNPQTQP